MGFNDRKKNQRNFKHRKPEIKPELKKCLNCFKRALSPPQCKCIPSKCDCPPGPLGPQGPAGPQGATGSPGGVLAFADFFALMPPNNAVTVAPGTDVDFPQDGPTSGTDIVRFTVDSIFLFSGWSKDRYKCLYFDSDGFAMLYKRLDSGKLQWLKNENEVRSLTQQEVRCLLKGLW